MMRTRALLSGVLAALALLAVGEVVLFFRLGERGSGALTPTPVLGPTLPPTPTVGPVALPAATTTPASPTATPTVDEAWRRTVEELNWTWEQDWPCTIALLDAFLTREPGHLPANQKLYAALIAEAAQLSTQGKPEQAARLLLRAETLLPHRREAEWALAALTPGPAPGVTPPANPEPDSAAVAIPTASPLPPAAVLTPSRPVPIPPRATATKVPVFPPDGAIASDGAGPTSTATKVPVFPPDSAGPTPTATKVPIPSLNRR